MKTSDIDSAKLHPSRTRFRGAIPESQSISVWGVGDVHTDQRTAVLPVL